MKFIYLKLLIMIYLFPTLALVVFSGMSFDFLSLGIFSFIIVIYGIAWDMWATRHGRKDKLWIWRFNSKTTTGVEIEHHPIEEYIFGILHIFWLVIYWEVLNIAIEENSKGLILLLVLVAIWQIWVGNIFYNSQKKKVKR